MEWCRLCLFGVTGSDLKAFVLRSSVCQLITTAWWRVSPGTSGTPPATGRPPPRPPPGGRSSAWRTSCWPRQTCKNQSVRPFSCRYRSVKCRPGVTLTLSHCRRAAAVSPSLQLPGYRPGGGWWSRRSSWFQTSLNLKWWTFLPEERKTRSMRRSCVTAQNGFTRDLPGTHEAAASPPWLWQPEPPRRRQ